MFEALGKVTSFIHMKILKPALMGLLSLVLADAAVAQEIDFSKQVQPILELHCIRCHGAERPKGGLRLDTLAAAIKGGDDGAALVVGNPEKSPLYTTTMLPSDHDDKMPPKDETLTKTQTDILKQWIQQGAKWPENTVLTAVKRVDFVKEIKPILELNCVSCHREGQAKGDLRLDIKSEAIKPGSIVPGDAQKSPVYTTTILPADHDDLMPPSNKGGPLPKAVTDLIREWINQGAAWPDEMTLAPRKAEVVVKNDLEVSAEIRAKILANLKVTQESEMKPFTDHITGTTVKFEMLPIPSGEFVMGSPENEPGRKADEGPQRKTKIAPFWMGKCEVTWNEFELFMRPEMEKDVIQAAGNTYNDKVSDAVSRPTKPYVEMSFGMGKEGFPAISMTQHAANKYCQWLSSKTGHFYRLPTEAEWEYACRAGTTTRYSFGDDPSVLGEYAWYGKNSDWKYQLVGKKKPNPWGLYDMHGNVAEWTIDGYDADYYKKLTDSIAANPWNKATTPYPHTVKGGSWDDDDVEKLRSAARRASDKSWKIQDPQLPKSIWYLTDAQFLGLRVVRPLQVPDAEALSKYWTSGVERE